MSETEQMLFETVQILESMNLMELLPFEVMVWYDARKLESELADNEDMRVMERRIDHFTNADATLQQGQRSVPEPVRPDMPVVS